MYRGYKSFRYTICDTFSHFVDYCLFIFFKVSSIAQKISIMFNLSISFVAFVLLESYLRNHCPIQDLTIYAHVFLYEFCGFSCYIENLIQTELIFVRGRGPFSFSQFHQHLLLKRYFFPIELSCQPCSDSVVCKCICLFLYSQFQSIDLYVYASANWTLTFEARFPGPAQTCQAEVVWLVEISLVLWVQDFPNIWPGSSSLCSQFFGAFRMMFYLFYPAFFSLFSARVLKIYPNIKIEFKITYL